MTATEHSVESLDRKLNEAILSGKALEAFDEYYADDVTMQENNGEPFAGKAVNREREVKFFSTVAQLHEIKLLASADLPRACEPGHHLEATRIPAKSRDWRRSLSRSWSGRGPTKLISPRSTFTS